MIGTGRIYLIALVLFTAHAGCSSFRPVKDRVRYFALSSASPQPGATSGAPEALTVGLRRVELPDYLLRKEIAFRRGQGEIEYSENLQWAERLDKGIQRVVLANLSTVTAPTNKFVSSWRQSDVMAEVEVLVQHFEIDEHGRARFEARWSIRNPRGATIWRTGATIRQQIGGSDLGQAIGSFNEALADLAKDISLGLRDSRQLPRVRSISPY